MSLNQHVTYYMVRFVNKLHSLRLLRAPGAMIFAFGKVSDILLLNLIYTYLQLVSKNAQKIKIDNIFRVTHTSNDSNDRIL